jgi:hypothetical protein
MKTAPVVFYFLYRDITLIKVRNIIINIGKNELTKKCARHIMKQSHFDVEIWP